MVLRIAAPHLLSDLAVSVGPEGRQVLCDLQGTVSGGEEVQGQRHRLIENPRRRLQAEDFLKSHAQNWAVSGSVVDRKAAAAGNIVMGWRQSVEIAPLAPVEQAGQEISAACAELQREVATCDEARALLGLSDAASD